MKNLALKIIANVLWVLCTAGVIGYLIYTCYTIHRYGAADIWLFILFFALSFLTAPGVHELGHFVFGLFSGMRAKLTLKCLLPSMRPSSVEIIPKKEDNIKSRLILTSLGGIFFNLLFIVLGVVALFVPQVPIWISPIAIWHLSLFFDNAIPVLHGTGKTDGLVIAELARNTPEGRVTLAVLHAQAHILSGKPIEQLEKSVLFDVPQIMEDDPAFISLTELRAEYCEAAGDLTAAETYRKRLKELTAG